MIDLNKKYRTRNGRVVSLRYIDGPDDPDYGQNKPFIIHGVIMIPVEATWTAWGNYSFESLHEHDLVKLPEEEGKDD
jgi:hypothetical protein